ncbi:TerD family protein [Streptomyces sp. NPDC050485]|uniref:TerD family protein n=1 Tax=Streptomyces sp. NPDC050485 TaxID=3365617 RepID=UPI0037922CD7
MSVPLAKGGNVSLSKQAPGLSTVTVGLGWRVASGPGAACDLDSSALLCDQAGKVLSDEHFVFFNNLRSPDGSVTHSGNGGPTGAAGDNEQIRVELVRVPPQVTKIVFAVSIYEAQLRGHSFGQVNSAYIHVVDQETGGELARYDLTGDASGETAMVFGELYRHGAEWKFRAVGQGYASGLAGIATDYGVDVLRESLAAAIPEKRVPPQPANRPATTGLPPAMSAAPSTTASPQIPMAPLTQPSSAPAQQPSGSSSMTCFFDPSHGPGMTSVMWSPQWGVPRPIQTCGGCAQRVQTTPPPYYVAPQAGYPQPVQPVQQQGYPQPGYPQPTQQGYVQQGGGHPEQPRRFGAGALIGAGAAGLVGGALLNEAFSDDEPDVVVNNYYDED